MAAWSRVASCWRHPLWPGRPGAFSCCIPTIGCCRRTSNFEAGLRETLVNSAESSAEFLDYPRFDGESYIRALTLFLNEKYARLPPTYWSLRVKNRSISCSAIAPNCSHGSRWSTRPLPGRSGHRSTAAGRRGRRPDPIRFRHHRLGAALASASPTAGGGDGDLRSRSRLGSRVARRSRAIPRPSNCRVSCRLADRCVETAERIGR